MIMKEWSLDELKVGTEARFDHRVTVEELDAFARLSGDRNPLHTDRAYARSAGYADRVVHGAFMSALVSRMVGMELPGQQSLLLGLKLDFIAPSFPEDMLEVSCSVKSTHSEQNVVVLRIRIRCGGELRARGSAMVRVRIRPGD
jgi:3-hydroxybutyryl-CoA dehydratase